MRMDELLAALAAYDTIPAFEDGKLRLWFPEETPPPAALVEEARANIVALGATLFPGTWAPVGELPDLRNVGLIALDLETRDGGIAAGLGPAWPWGDGHICGVSVAYHREGETCAHYFPIRHPASYNFDTERVFRWLRDHVASDVRFVTQNGLYDWGWLYAEAGIHMPPSDQMEEIGALATIVDENQHKYSLDALCEWRGIPGKDEAGLKAAAVALSLVRGRSKAGAVKGALWKMPAHCVGPYAEADATATLALFENLYPTLAQENTLAAYRLEVDLLPMVLEMRRRGIRVDQSAAERLRDQLEAKRGDALLALSEQLGALVGMEEIKKPKWLKQTHEAQGVQYELTEKGNPSFKGGKRGWMTNHEHFLPRLISEANKYHEAASKFVGNYILGHLIDGRIHAGVNPHRGDDGEGAVTTRFSYKDPPLQQVPKRDKELGPEIRSCFLPEEGELWATLDASQQEYRLLVHFAEKHDPVGAKFIGDQYRSKPETDMHRYVSEITDVPRDDAKNINFAKVYGGGVPLLAKMMSKTIQEAEEALAKYDSALPFVKSLTEACEQRVRERGYLRLYDGARRHWREEHAVFKATNALIQGSAARHTKLWMRACWREGIVPLLQMHDALECSLATREQAEHIQQLGREAVSLTIPMLIDAKLGPTWGDAIHSWDEMEEKK
jgi:DNA polymerase I-like protein with 3'-5' exonuclease and polymerase domains